MQKINERMLALIDQVSQDDHAKEGMRKHLGASVIGDKCLRKVWYEFRWAKKEQFTSQKLRLFSRGHYEEPRFVEYLRRIGIIVQEVDENGNQFRISDVMGHFGGSGDGKGWVPLWMLEGLEFDHSLLVTDPQGNQYLPILCEFKTLTYKDFPAMVKHGVRKQNEKHGCQMDTYGFKMGIHYAIYMVVNKNTDHLHLEFVKLNHKNGARMVELGRELITNPDPPMRPYGKTSWNCKWCHLKRVCHYGDPMKKNCRSCKHAVPTENKEWGCNLLGAILPEDFIPKGCDSWEQLDNV